MNSLKKQPYCRARFIRLECSSTAFGNTIAQYFQPACKICDCQTTIKKDHRLATIQVFYQRAWRELFTDTWKYITPEILMSALAFAEISASLDYYQEIQF